MKINKCDYCLEELPLGKSHVQIQDLNETTYSCINDQTKEMFKAGMKAFKKEHDISTRFVYKAPDDTVSVIYCGKENHLYKSCRIRKWYRELRCIVCKRSSKSQVRTRRNKKWITIVYRCSARTIVLHDDWNKNLFSDTIE